MRQSLDWRYIQRLFQNLLRDFINRLVRMRRAFFQARAQLWRNFQNKR